VTNTPTTVPTPAYILQWSTNTTFDIYADTTNNLIYLTYDSPFPGAVFDLSGNFVRGIGTFGSTSGPATFDTPLGIVTDGQGNVWISDFSFNYVQQLFYNGTTTSYVTTFGSAGSGNGQFNNPGALALDGNGHIFVVDFGNARVQKLDYSGNLIWQVSAPGGAVGSVCYSGGYLYFSAPSASNPVVKVQDLGASTGTVTNLCTLGPGVSQLVEAGGIAVASNGNFYVTNGSNVKEFDSGGNYLMSWDGTGSGTAFSDAIKVVLDNSGDIYVDDRESAPTVGRVVKFSP
jgi:tripartite motif-containing protein 71